MRLSASARLSKSLASRAADRIEVESVCCIQLYAQGAHTTDANLFTTCRASGEARFLYLFRQLSTKMGKISIA